MMKDMPASVEPMIRRNGSLGKAQPRLCREQLDRLSVDRDRVVVIDLCLISLTKDVPHVRVLRKRSPCRLRVFRGNAEEPSVLGDEGFVQILRRPFAVGDILKPKLSDKPVLEGPVDPLASSSGLSRMGKDEPYRSWLMALWNWVGSTESLLCRVVLNWEAR